MNISNKEYDKYIQSISPKSKVWRNSFLAFITGGSICAIGQLFLNLYRALGVNDELASTLVSVTLIFLSALFTGLNIYPKIAKHGGAGTLVPVTGFANAVTAPAIESKTEGYILGVGAKIFTIAGPVILFGTLSSMICGLIYYLFLMG